MRKSVFCEYQFIKSIEVDPFSTDYKEEKRKYELRRIFESAIENSDIYFDLSPQQINEVRKKDSYFESILETGVDGYYSTSILDCGYNEFINSSHNNWISPIVFFSKDDEDCIKLKQKFGIYAVNEHSLISLEKDFREDGFSTKKGEENSWNSHFTDNNFICNSLILTDKYVLTKKWAYEFDVVPILNKILPKTLDIPFQIGVFSSESKGLTTENQCKKLITEIQKIRPDLNFKLTLFKVDNDDLHDRYIITNYFWIKVGSGFDLIKRDDYYKTIATHTTEVELNYPFVQEKKRYKRDTFENMLRDTVKIRNNASNIKGTRNYWNMSFFENNVESPPDENRLYRFEEL